LQRPLYGEALERVTSLRGRGTARGG